MALEHAGPEQDPEGTGRPPVRLGGVDGHEARADLVVGGPGAGVGVQDQAPLGHGRPDRLVDRLVVGRGVEPAGRDHHAPQAPVGRLVDLGHRGVDVDHDRDDGDADAAVGLLGAEVGQPAVVGPGPGEDQLGVTARGVAQPGAERRGGHPAGAEHVGVGEQDLGGHALAVEPLVAGIGVVGGVQAAVAGLGLPLLAEVLVHRLLELADHAQLGLVGVELRVVRPRPGTPGSARPAGRRGRRRRSAGSGHRGGLGAHSSPFSWTGRRPAAKASPRLRRVSAIFSRPIMTTKSSSLMPAINTRASSLRSCQGSW